MHRNSGRPNMKKFQMQLPRRVSDECRSAARRLEQLQAAIGDELAQEKISYRMIGEMQSLDLVRQTLDDIAVSFEAFNATSASSNIDFLEAASQEVFRRRIKFGAIEEQVGSIELFEL